jgi:dihydrofolate synthase/folylpolyglutamate synthase
VVAVITKIGFDHTAILGDTIEKIAYEKCCILRDCPVITSYHQDEKALEVIKMQANKLYIPDKNNNSPVFYKKIQYLLLIKNKTCIKQNNNV